MLLLSTVDTLHLVAAGITSADIIPQSQSVKVIQLTFSTYELSQNLYFIEKNSLQNRCSCACFQLGIKICLNLVAISLPQNTQSENRATLAASQALRRRRVILIPWKQSSEPLVVPNIMPSSQAKGVSMAASSRRSRYNLLRTFYHNESPSKWLNEPHLTATSNNKMLGSLYYKGCNNALFVIPMLATLRHL